MTISRQMDSDRFTLTTLHHIYRTAAMTVRCTDIIYIVIIYDLLMWMPSVSWPIKQAVDTARTMEKSRTPPRRMMAVRRWFVYYISFISSPRRRPAVPACVCCKTKRHSVRTIIIITIYVILYTYNIYFINDGPHTADIVERYDIVML